MLAAQRVVKHETSSGGIRPDLERIADRLACVSDTLERIVYSLTGESQGGGTPETVNAPRAEKTPVAWTLNGIQDRVSEIESWVDRIHNALA